MHSSTIDQKVTFKFVIVSFVAVLLTWFFHELTHWITSEALGYDALMKWNKVTPIEGMPANELHFIYISAAGPIFTILQAVVVYFILMKGGWNKMLYPLLFIPFYMRLLAGGFNVMRLNDEGKVGDYFGLGDYTLSIIVSAFLLFLVYKASKKYGLKASFHVWNTLLVMFFSSIIILADQAIDYRIL